MSFSVDTLKFQDGIRKLAALNNKTQAETLLGFGRTTLRNQQGTGIIDMTPPASPKVTGVDAKRQGEAAIDRDLRKVFAGVRLKHARPEQFPDPEAIHARLYKGKRPGTPLRSDRGHQKYFVDIVKLRVLAKKLKSRVGKMAASWIPSAQALGVNVPGWITRHGAGPGNCKINLTAPQYSIAMEAFPGSKGPVNELRRRVSIAMGFTQQRLGRAIAGTSLAKNARLAGFKASS